LRSLSRQSGRVHDGKALLGMDMCTHIVPGIYIAGISDLGSAWSDTSRDITAVLSILSGSAEAYRELVDYVPSHVHHLFISLDDTTDASLLATLHQSLPFMHEHARPPRRNVLVHCFAGESRSVATVLAYMLAAQTPPRPTTVSGALGIVRRAHPKAAPNPAFLRQLHAFEAFCRDRPLCKGSSNIPPMIVNLDGWTFSGQMPLERWHRLSDRTRKLILLEFLHALAAARAYGQESYPLSNLLLRPDTKSAIPSCPDSSRESGSLYHARCRSCRDILASSLFVVQGNVRRDNTVSVAPMLWMLLAVQSLLSASVAKPAVKGGRLRCPRCECKVGGFGWDLALKLEATTEPSQQIPYFNLNKSAVDWMQGLQ
jgi:predicted protein tyrosine phosphatase